MKTLATALAMSFAVIAGAAQAADAPPTKTRAQVVAELQAAQSQGLISEGELDYPIAQTASSHKSRAEVQAELAAAQSTGQISEGELDYPPVAVAESDKSRAQVQAELFDYVSSGQIVPIEA